MAGHQGASDTPRGAKATPDRQTAPPATPAADLEAFLARWSPSGGGERSNYQLFLTELCQVLAVPRPNPAVPDDAANAYVFDRGIPRQEADGSTTPNFIDLYKRACFVCETKQGVERDRGEPTLGVRPKLRTGHGIRGSGSWDTAMEKARNQAEQYARALPATEGRPPFLLVVDVGYSIELFAEFTCTGGTYVRFPDPTAHRIFLTDLRDPRKIELLRAIWTDPLSLDPARRSARVTRDISVQLARLATSFQKQGHDAQVVADFLMRCIFTMFAEDVRLLPPHCFKHLLESLKSNPRGFPVLVEGLWKDMARGAEFSTVVREKVLRFNGGLFESATALPVTAEQLDLLLDAAKADWRDVEPAIFGTLLERALSPQERHKLGAHHTPRAYVERLVFPTVIDPLRADWETVKTAAAQLTADTDAAEARAEALEAEAGAVVKRGDAQAARAHGKEIARLRKEATARRKEAVEEVRQFHRALCRLRVLDPACGCANFLYVTMEHLKRLEGEVLELLTELGDPQLEAEMREFKVRPHQFIGLEINPWAVPIAELVLWIGYLQWHFRTSDKAVPDDPVISKEHSIRLQDAVLAYDRKELITWAMARENPDLPGLPDDVREKLRQERSAGWQPAVSPTGSRRRGEAAESAGRTGPTLDRSEAGGLPTRDTADSQSALRQECEAALGANAGGTGERKAPSPLRSAGAVQSEAPPPTHPITVWDGRTMKKHPVTGKDVPDDTARVPLWRYVNPRQADWPEADYVVGNPPFLGSKRMRECLGWGYASCLLETWGESVPGSADFVFYWWHKAAELVRAGKVRQFGFITTNTLTQETGRAVTEPHLDAAKRPLNLTFAIPDHPWVDSSDGAAVRIAMTVGSLGGGQGTLCQVAAEAETLNGEHEVSLTTARGSISSRLRLGARVSSAVRLKANSLLCWQGCKLVGAGFQVSPAEAERFSRERPANAMLLRSYWAGSDVTKKREPRFVIDFTGMARGEAQVQHPELYQHLLDHVFPERAQNRDQTFREKWWLFGRRRPELREALGGLTRYIVTSEVAKHRAFMFLAWPHELIDGSIMALALDDAHLFGVVSSRAHVCWALATGGRMGVGNDPRYQAGPCFETFPFPDPDDATRERIRSLGEQLDAHRKRQQALHPGLTLTGMYNVLEKLRAGGALTAKEKVIHDQGLVSVLKQIHDDLDAAVFAAYQWPATLSDEEILERLVALNHERAEEEKRGHIRWLRPDFQCRDQGQRPVQSEMIAAGEAPSERAPNPPSAIRHPPSAWPKPLAAQVEAVRRVLSAAGGPVTAAEVAARFQRANRERVTEILQTLVALGKARETGGGRFQA